MSELTAVPEPQAEIARKRVHHGVAPLTLAHNVASEEEVDAVLAAAAQAGADPISPAVGRSWGGYSGYFGDPDGYRWEIACAPGQVNDIVVPKP